LLGDIWLHVALLWDVELLVIHFAFPGRLKKHGVRLGFRGRVWQIAAVIGLCLEARRPTQGAAFARSADVVERHPTGAEIIERLLAESFVERSSLVGVEHLLADALAQLVVFALPQPGLAAQLPADHYRQALGRFLQHGEVGDGEALAAPGL